jgi:hypothetical protein
MTTHLPTPTETPDPAHECELCNLPAGADYYSDHRCNTTGVGVVLHTRCAVVLAPLDAATVVALLAAAREAHRLVGFMGLDLDVDAAQARREREPR